MKSKIVLAGLAALLALVLVSPARLMAARGGGDNYYFGFENGDKALSAWQPASNTSSATSSLGIVTGENGCPDMNGFHYAALKSSTLSNSLVPKFVPYPIGTWALTAVPAGGRNIVSIDFNAKSTAACEGCSPMVYVGPNPPTSITQFAIADGATYLKAYWQTFHHHQIVFEGVVGTVYVALGWPGTNASIGLDCISVEVTPIESTSAK